MDVDGDAASRFRSDCQIAKSRLLSIGCLATSITAFNASRSARAWPTLTATSSRVLGSATSACSYTICEIARYASLSVATFSRLRQMLRNVVPSTRFSDCLLAAMAICASSRFAAETTSFIHRTSNARIAAFALSESRQSRIVFITPAESVAARRHNSSRANWRTSSDGSSSN